MWRELYDNPRPRRGETAGEAVATAALHAYDGAVFALATDARPVQESRGEEGTRRFVLPLRLTDVPPGQYALRVQAILPDGSGDQVALEIRVTVR